MSIGLQALGSSGERLFYAPISNQLLARIAECEVLDRGFTPRPELAPQGYEAHVFVTERGDKPYEVVLRFDAYQARWIRERSWHPSQQVDAHPDGGLTLRLTVGGGGDLLRWVLGYGSHVEVVSPPSLRQRPADLPHLRASASLRLIPPGTQRGGSPGATR
ncbi:MAG: transcriptional regulator-like protein, partial [Armatimonadetes bacterium]|nr:transcriptional regulator-like protein [Armatimonadota bacterium]